LFKELNAEIVKIVPMSPNFLYYRSVYCKSVISLHQCLRQVKYKALNLLKIEQI